MLLFSIAVLSGFILLIWGADKFVEGAAAIAHNLGVSTLLIGLTIVGLGTSAPEILVSIMASSNGNGGLAIGNALGSNITNIALVLGATALVIPLTVHSNILRREYPMLLSVTVLGILLMIDGQLSQMDGIILLSALLIVLFIMWRMAISQRTADPLVDELDDEIPINISSRKATINFIIGLLVLLISSKMLVWGAIGIAKAFGLSDLIIGLTIVALGTSLPELAASITSAKRGEHDIAVGNVIGSNIFNLLAVLAVPALMTPGPFDSAAIFRDAPVMLLLTVLLFLFAYGFCGKPGRINRLEASVFVLIFIGYQGFLFYSISGIQ